MDVVMKVYLCGPINGCTDEECKDWRAHVAGRLPNTVDPMVRDYRGKELTHFREIVELDKLDIMGCEALIVNYDKPSVGTSMEILYAWQSHKTIILVHAVGANLSPWLRYHCTHLVTSFDDAVALCK